MDRDQIGVLLREANKLTHHTEFVIMGSLSVLGAVAQAPAAMLLSIDVDLYPLRDPGRAGEIARSLGQGTAFEREHGYYADAVSPALAALPEGWENRLHRIEYSHQVVGLYLDPNDAAVAKLARNEPRDRRWVREGIKAGIVDGATVERRMASAPFLDQAEQDRARRSLSEQRRLAERGA